jgi:hypothetical protein
MPAGKKITPKEGAKCSGWVRPDKESSRIKFIQWTEGDLLDVEFNSGKKFQYQNVTRDEFTEFRQTASPGSWFYNNIQLKEDIHPFAEL